MSKSVPFRVSLQRDVVVLLLVFGALILGTMVVSTRLIVGRMSAQLIDAALDQTEDHLRTLFRPVGGAVGFLGKLVEAGELDPDDPTNTVEVLRVALTQLPNISSVLLADEDGVETLVIQREGGWYIRHTDPARHGGASEVIEEDADGVRSESVRDLGYSAETRPWFHKAIERYHSAEPGVGARDLVEWTEPYEFFTTKQTGVTASAAFRSADGRLVVVAADVALTEINERASELSNAERGAVLVVMRDDAGNWVVVGLPDAEMFPGVDPERYRVLRAPQDLGTEMGIALGKYLDRYASGTARGRAVRMKADGRTWWANARMVKLDGAGKVWFSVAVEPGKLTPGLWVQRGVVLGFVALAVILMMRRVRVLAHRFSEPIEGIVVQSERISRLDLEEHGRITSSVREIDRLADAQERMRISLRSLVKLEGDLRLARQIQQQTLPDGWPKIEGFEIAAWGEPADETGGDSYDVIGCVRDGACWRVSDGETCEKMYVLLADATGHGIGPALSVTQLRSMLRMGIRSGEGLGEMACAMNDQLCEDLVAGRFITAWFGEIDGASRSMRTFSAGQGPSLHWRAGEGRAVALAVDTPPLGVIAGMDAPIGEAVQLARGDIVAVFSDGIYEAMSPTMEQFGQERVERLLSEHKGSSANAIINALQIAMIEFCGERPADDDRTAIVIKAV